MALVAIAAATALCALALTPVHAQVLPQKKVMTLIVAGAPGSAYDVYGRALSRYMKQHLPGEPDIVVKNMHGAGGSIAAEFMHSQAPTDGSMMFLMTAGALIDPLFNPGRYKFDPTKFEYLGTLDQDTRACLTAERSPVKTFADAKLHSVIMAGTQPGSSTVDYPNMLNVLTGTRFKLVQGYRGTPAVMLAIERGEADGMCIGTLATVRPWLGKANFFVQIALHPHPDTVKYNIPSIFDLAPEEAKPVLKLIATQQVFGRPVVLPAGTAPEQVKALRAAFMSTVKDPGFEQELTKLKLDLNPLDGGSVADLVKEMYAAPHDLIERMAKALKPTS